MKEGTKMDNTIDYTARKPVWSGLGRDISGCRSIDEALAVSGLDFQVRQANVCTDDGNYIPLRGFKANVKDDGTPLGIVTTKYKVVQNADAFGFLDSLISDGMKLERAGGLQDGRKVFVLARMPEKYIISGESISPYIVFINSHDGTGSIKVLMTPIRMICLNMLNLALENATRSWSAIHCGDVDNKLEDARNTLLYAERYMNALGSEIEDMKHTILSEKDVFRMVDELLPTEDDMSEIQKKNIKKQRDDILSRFFHAPDLADMKCTAYRFINAVSDFATHSEPIRRRENYNETLFNRTVEGSPIVDKAYGLLKAAA